MSKQKKKRNKRYQGAEAAKVRPTVTRVKAVNRNRLSQWWFERKRIAKPILITAAVVIALAILLFEILRIIFGW